MIERAKTKSRPRRTRRRWLARLCLAAGGLCAGIALAEIALRLVGVSFPLPYAPDEYCGSRLQPGFEAWFTKEGRACVSVNSAGFRDREHSRNKPADTVRIAVLGDSFAEALQVPLEQTFWHLLERELTHRKTFGNRRVEVLNFGVSGYGTAQELQALRHYAFSYHPDIVVLAFFSGNDVRNNSERLEPYRVRPFFTWSNDTLVLDDRFLTHPDYRKANSAVVKLKVGLINRSRILQLANEWRGRSARRPAGTPAERLDMESKTVFLEPSDEDWRQAWEITERLIEQVHIEAAEQNARFILVCVSHPIQVHPDVHLREELCRDIGASDLFYPEQRLESLAERKGFEIVTLAQPMQKHAERHNVYLHGFPNTGPGTGHWNQRGHELAAQLIADGLEKAMISISASGIVECTGGRAVSPLCSVKRT
ncbi:MAG: hypothetical protein ACC628_11705 [Pirellulaceae bacterium]